MALDLNIRRARADDLAFAVKAAGAAGSLWNEDTARSYRQSPDHVLGVLTGRWPERGIAQFVPVGFVHAYIRPGSSVAHVQHLAIDESLIPDVPVNSTARRRIADKLLIEVLSAADALGIETAITRHIPIGHRLIRYLDTIGNVTRNEDGVTIDFSGNVKDVLAQLRARE